MEKKHFWGPALVFTDILMFNLSFKAAYAISNLIYAGKVKPVEAYFGLLVFANFTLVLTLLSSGLYRRKRSLFDSEEFYMLLKSTGLAYLIITAATFMTKGADYSRLIVTNTFAVSVLAITISRSMLNIVLSSARRRGMDKQKTVILGRNPAGKSLLARIRDHPELGYDFAGFVELTTDLRRRLSAGGVQTVFVTPNEASKDGLIDLVTGCDGVDFKIIPDLVELISDPLSFDEFRDIPIITVRGQGNNTFYRQRAKRVLDVTIAGIMLALLSPLLALAAVAIKIDSRGPVLFRQVRVGKDGKTFTALKFRSMVENAEGLKPGIEESNEAGWLFKLRRDPRVTRVGYLLRRTCIDELPQLFNILGGEMSLVGPRPHIPDEMKYFRGWRKGRFKVKPGLTGVWQTSGRHEIDLDKAALMDIYYIRHMSLMLDLKILIKTLPSIVYSKGRW